MRVKSMLTVGFLSMMAATAVANASDSFPAPFHRVDVIDTPNETEAQLDSAKAGDKQIAALDQEGVIDAPNETVAQFESRKAGGEGMRVDVIDSIPSGGPAYPYTKPTSH